MTGDLYTTLEQRFHKNPKRHKGVRWEDVKARLDAADSKILHALSEMERTGGEPDVIGYDKATGAYLYCDCSPETPKGRRSICYDEAALQSRKENKPAASAYGMAEAMGVEILNEEQYRSLQKLGEFDLKTSSWIATPAKIRSLGGALFCDRRYDTVFVYHNGAESYYAVRGFRALVRV
ncbi:hypothetical protein F183_A03110 [Bryobacterales bacterium F-183]|nr:hypothetical protein F183_A03110 [Bryobacterales bacterium F-183]